MGALLNQDWIQAWNTIPTSLLRIKDLLHVLIRKGLGEGDVERAHAESPDTFIFYLKFYDQSVTCL